jgi:hypothetical protein
MSARSRLLVASLGIALVMLALRPASAAPAPAATPTPTAKAWETAALLAAPGEPGRLYALMKDSAGPLWAFPAGELRLMISDDYAATWTPFPGGLPAPADCVRSVNLDYATSDGLWAGTCQGLYAWDPAAEAWVKRSDRVTHQVAVAYGEPAKMVALAGSPYVIRSGDGGATWSDASAGLSSFGGMASLGLDPRDNRTLYGIIKPRYAGSYLRRAVQGGQWQTMPAPKNNTPVNTGMAVDGGTGNLYVVTNEARPGLWKSDNPSAVDVRKVKWQRVKDFGPDFIVDLLASGWSPQGLALYVQAWPLKPMTGGAAVGAPFLARSPDGGKSWEMIPTP